MKMVHWYLAYVCARHVLIGGVEMEEKGERYRDGEKVCITDFAPC